MPATSVETQKPLLPRLPQHILPTNSSCRDMHFPPQPSNAASLHIPVLSLNKCKIAVLHALSLSLAVSECWIPTEKCPIFTYVRWLQRKQILFWKQMQGPYLWFPRSVHVLVALSQVWVNCKCKAGIKACSFLRRGDSHDAWIGTSFSSLVVLCFAS